MKTIAVTTALAVLLSFTGCGRNAKDSFVGWARALQTRNAEVVARFDRDLAERTSGISKDARDEFVADLAAHLERPAATAVLETGLGAEPSAYPRKLFFSPGSRIRIRSEEARGTDGVRLLVEVSYPRDHAPVYVTEVQVVWHGPLESPPGMPPTGQPVAQFNSGYLEHGHPFLANPGYRGHELKLHSGLVRTATLKVELARDAKLGWTITDLTPLVAENRYWD